MNILYAKKRKDLMEHMLRKASRHSIESCLGEISTAISTLNANIVQLRSSIDKMDDTPHQFYRKRISRALDELFEFIDSNMPGAVFVGGDRMQIKGKALEAAPESGAYMEFGVYNGHSVNYLAAHAKDKIFHGFDSFEGLPEQWGSGHCALHNTTFFDKGSFKTVIPVVEDNVLLHNGYFHESVPEWKKNFSDNIAFLHIDCDLYSSTHCVLEQLADRIVSGTIIVFDEFFGYAEWRQGEYKAFTEFVEKYDVTYEYIFYRYDCVVVRITSIATHNFNPQSD